MPLYNRCYFRQQVPIRKFSPAVLLPAWPAKGPPPSEAGPPADGFLKHREKGHPLPGTGQNPARPAAASCVPPYGNPAPASGHLSVFSEIPRHVPLSSPPVMFNKLHFLTPLSLVVEGVNSAKAAKTLAEKYGIDMPIVNEVNKVLFENKTAREAMADLMLRDKKIEHPELPWKK